MIRNLIYYVCPINSNNQWVENINMLAKYQGAFNGRKIICIATEDERVEDPKVVKREISKKISGEIEFLKCPNFQPLGEVYPFAKMARMVKSENENEITFYAHAKGVSPRYSQSKTDYKMRNKIIWRNLMYHYCLNDIEKIEDVMKTHVSAGCIKRNVRMLRFCQAKWHYAGNFFWFKHAPVFSNDDWDKLRLVRVGVEAYMGENFANETGYCFFGEDMPYSIVNFSNEKWERYLSKYNLDPDKVYKGNFE